MKPEECVVVEDTVVGVRSALGAGTTCYVFLNGVNKKEEFHDLQVAGFLETEKDFSSLLGI